MALTSGSVTIKTAGGTYSTWAAFWDDLGNLTGNITCTVDASAFTEASVPAAVTESLGGHTLHVLPASFPTKTDASDGARFTVNNAGAILNFGMEGPGYVIIEGMVFIEGTSEPGYCAYLGSVNTQFNFTYRRNIIKGCNYGFFQGDITMDTGTKVYNNIIYDVSAIGLYLSVDIPHAIIANNTIHNCKDNVDSGDEQATFKNNLSYAAVEQCFQNIELLTNGYNNAESDGTGADGDWGGIGSNNLTNIADPFNAIASDDFTITAEGVIGTAGLDLSADFTDDFFGTPRVNWTIGACEFVSPPPDIEKSIDVTLEVESSLGRKLKFPLSSFVDIMTSIGRTLTFPLSPLIEVKTDLTRGLKFSIEPLIEVEAYLLSVIGLRKSLSALIEVDASTNLELVASISPLLSIDIAGARHLGFSLLSLVEVKIAGDKTFTLPLSTLINMGVECTKEFGGSRLASIDVRMEPRVDLTRGLTFPAAALVETEVIGARTLTLPLSVLIEMLVVAPATAIHPPKSLNLITGTVIGQGLTGTVYGKILSEW